MRPCYSSFEKHAEYDKIPNQDPYEQRHELKERPNIPELEFIKIVGHGNFSHVYEGKYKNKKVAIKVIERGNEYSINTEIEILQELSNTSHITNLLHVFNDPQPILVFDYVNSIYINSFFGIIKLNELKYLLKSVLEALNVAHNKGIVHRDVKLQNILVENGFKNIVLIDWGSGAFVSDSLNSKAGSRSIRPPEMLLGYRGYGTKCDIWAIGILILYFLTNGKIPWKTRSSVTSLLIMSNYFGKSKIIKLAEKYNLKIPRPLDNQPDEPILSIESSFISKNKNIYNNNLFNLMNLCLSIDPNDRPTASMALSHPFFQNE